MTGINLKVSPDILKAKAQEIRNEISRFEADWNQLLQIVQNTKGYWAGDASTAHQNQIKNYQDEFERIIKRLKEHPDDLLKMANIYEKSEQTAEKISQILPNDVII